MRRRLTGRPSLKHSLTSKSFTQKKRPCLGVEVKFYHLRLLGLEMAEFVGRLEAACAARFIVLKRENYLRKLVSSVVGAEARRYHLRAGEKASMTRVSIDPERVAIDAEIKPMLAFFEDYDAGYAQLDQLLHGKDVLRLTYEQDIFADPLVAYRKVCDFIGVEIGSPNIGLAKTNPFPLEEIVSNYDELKSALRSTPYKWMIE